MALNIQWAKEATKQLDKVIEHLESDWSEKETRAFFIKLEEATKHISQSPSTFKVSERRKDAREYQLTPHTTIFYDFDDTTATILLLWPNRMDPEKLK